MRIQVNLSEEMVAKVDKYASLLGVSRSALCALFIGNGVLGYSKAEESLSSLFSSLDAPAPASDGSGTLLD